MEHQFVVEMDYSDSEIRDFFLFEKSKTVPNVQNEIKTNFEKSDIVCIQLTRKLDNFLIECIRNSVARVYLISSNIDEKELNPLTGRVIAREVPNLHYNMVICDGSQVIVFNDDYEGFETKQSSEIMQQLFNRWFWQNSDFEYLDKKRPVHDTTFDDVQIVGNENVILGSDISTLISRSEEVITSASYSDRLSSKIQVVKNPLSNGLQSKEASLFYAPDMPLSFCISSGKMFFINIDPANYYVCPEKNTDKIYAIATEFDGFGKMYRYVKKCVRKQLINKEMRRYDGTDFVMNESSEKITDPVNLDLSNYHFYKKLKTSDIEMRLLKSNPKLFSHDDGAVHVKFIIPVNISKHRSSEKLPLYRKYEYLSKVIDAKINEIEKSTKNTLQSADNSKILGFKRKKYTTSSDFNNDVSIINPIIEKYNATIVKSTDDALGEVLEAKSKKNEGMKRIQLLESSKLDPLPSFGTMYVTKDGYEYVIRTEPDLDQAIDECEKKKMFNVTYHLE